VNSEPEPPSSSDLRRRALDLLEHNLRRVETTPRRLLDPNLIRTEADQAVVNVSAAFETLNALGLITEADHERFFRRLREITSTACMPFKGVELERDSRRAHS
jgi:glycyl-tRNA synthetase alpha subunit